MPLNIAIDGPVGAGKSTVADAVAQRLNILHLDTGAMYRAVGYLALQKGVDIADEAAVTALCQEAEVDVRYEDGAQRTRIDGQDVTARIRTSEVGMAASAVSRYAGVRARLVARQRALAAREDMVLDGRDIGTNVLPGAPVKVFLTASAPARARRRFLELQSRGDPTPYEAVLAALLARDRQDATRAQNPLRQAGDAVLLDTTDLTFEQTVDAILALVEEKYGKPC